MANHGYVKTRKHMTPEAITALIDELNQSHFKGVLTQSNSAGGWGEHTWLLNPKGRDYDTRVCWLNSKRSFEMRHGGGTNFMWWVDSVILDHVAARFNGKVSDDGIEDVWPGDTTVNKTFEEYLERMYRGGVGLPKEVYANLMRQSLEDAPPEFQFQKG